MKKRPLTRPQLRKRIREKYALLLKTARVLLGTGFGHGIGPTKIDMDVFEYQGRWQAAVFPKHGNITYEGFVVDQCETERDALAALDALLSAVTGAMNPFMKKARKSR